VNIVTLVGSARKDSYNRSIANYIQKRYEELLTVELVDIKDLPHFDQDQEEDPPAKVKEFKKKIKDSDGVLIVTPEYNHSVPGMLKNAIDWTSRVDHVMTGKPVLIIGSSPGMLGTVRCQLHLRQILAAPGVSAKVLPGNEVFIGMVHEKLDDQGSITDEPTIKFLDMVLHNFIKFQKEIINKTEDK